MKTQLRNITPYDIKTLFNNVSKIVSKLDNINNLYSLRTDYEISSEFLKNNNLNDKTYCKFMIYTNKYHNIILYLYDEPNHPEECDIITKEDNVLFKDQLGTDIIFVPKQLLMNNTPIENVYTALFVIFHLSLRMISGFEEDEILRSEDENYTSLSSLFATLIVSEDIFSISNNVFHEYKEFVKEAVDKLYNCGSLKVGSYPYFIDDITINNINNAEFFSIISEYFHKIHLHNGVQDYEQRRD